MMTGGLIRLDINLSGRTLIADYAITASVRGGPFENILSTVSVVVFVPLEANLTSQYHSGTGRDATDGETAASPLLIRDTEKAGVYATLAFRGGDGAYTLTASSTESAESSNLNVRFAAPDEVVIEGGATAPVAGVYTVVVETAGAGTTLTTSVYIDILAPLASAPSSQYRAAGDTAGDTASDPLRIPESAIAGDAIFATLALSGGAGAYSITGMETDGGTLSGTFGGVLNGDAIVVNAPAADAPSEEGIYEFRATVSDALGDDFTASLHIEILPPVSFTISSANSRDNFDGSSAAAPLQVPEELANNVGFGQVLGLGGDGTYTFNVASTTNPRANPTLRVQPNSAGLTLDFDGIGGAVALVEGEVYSAVVEITDGVGQSLTTTLFVRVLPPLTFRYVKQFGAQDGGAPNNFVFRAARNIFLLRAEPSGGLGGYTGLRVGVPPGGAALNVADTFNQVAIRFDGGGGAQPTTGLHRMTLQISDSLGTQIRSTITVSVAPPLAFDRVRSAFQDGDDATEGNTAANSIGVPFVAVAAGLNIMTVEFRDGFTPYNLDEDASAVLAEGGSWSLALNDDSDAVIVASTPDAENPAEAGAFTVSIVIRDPLRHLITVLAYGNVEAGLEAEVQIDNLPLTETNPDTGRPYYGIRDNFPVDTDADGNAANIFTVVLSQGSVPAGESFYTFGFLQGGGEDGNFDIQPRQTPNTDAQEEYYLNAPPTGGISGTIRVWGEVRAADTTRFGTAPNQIQDRATVSLDFLVLPAMTVGITDVGNQGTSAANPIQVIDGVVQAGISNPVATIRVDGSSVQRGGGLFFSAGASTVPNSGDPVLRLAGSNVREQVLFFNDAASAGPIVQGVYTREVEISDAYLLQTMTVTVYVEVAPLQPLSYSIGSQYRSSGGNEGDAAATPLRIPQTVALAASPLATVFLQGGLPPYDDISGQNVQVACIGGSAIFPGVYSGNQVILSGSSGAPQDPGNCTISVPFEDSLPTPGTATATVHIEILPPFVADSVFNIQHRRQ